MYIRRVPSAATASSSARWISSGPPATAPTARTDAWIITTSPAATPSARKSFASCALECIGTRIMDPARRRTMPALEFERPVFRRVRRLCLALPDTKEASSWGHPNFRAGKKTFCAFELFGGRPSIAFRLTPAEVKGLAGRRYFFATPYGRGVWVSRSVDRPVSLKLIEALIHRSYRQVASRKLVRLLDSERS